MANSPTTATTVSLLYIVKRQSLVVKKVRGSSRDAQWIRKKTKKALIRLREYTDLMDCMRENVLSFMSRYKYFWSHFFFSDAAIFFFFFLGINPYAKLIKIPRPLLISSQSDYFIWVFDRKSHI